MLIGDFGTSYCKILDISTSGSVPQIISSRQLPAATRVAMATGHIGKRYGDIYTNELIALARGGESLIDDQDYVLLDCGSRDIKFIQYRNGKLADMGWNAECGASMGFTIELLERYYELDFVDIAPPQQAFSVTCGVLGMSNIFDAVISGMEVTEAVARFVKGIALNAYRFAGSPEKLYLSGGLCDNPVFVASLPGEVIPLGRFVLLEGLRKAVERI